MKELIRAAFRIWALALGEKAGKHNREADTVAIVRTFIFASYLITNIAICANAIRHWNDNECIPQATKKGSLSSPYLQNQGIGQNQ